MKKLDNTPACKNQFERKECSPWERKRMPEIWSVKPVAEQDLSLRVPVADSASVPGGAIQHHGAARTVRCQQSLGTSLGKGLSSARNRGVGVQTTSRCKAQAYRGREKPD